MKALAVIPANPSTRFRAGAGIYSASWLAVALLCGSGQIHAMIPAAAFYAGGGADYAATNSCTDTGAFVSLGLVTRGSYWNVDLGKAIDSGYYRGSLEAAHLIPLYSFSRAVMIVPSVHLGALFSEYSGVYAGLGISLYPFLWISYSAQYFPLGNGYFDRHVVDTTLRARLVYPIGG